MKKGVLLYEGKAKKVFAVDGDAKNLYVEYKDTLTALNGVKKGSFAGKGALNRNLTADIFKYLAKNGVRTHFRESVESEAMICEKLTMIPLEVVVRNRVAGSFAKKFSLEEGAEIKGAIVEFYYKNDALNDPFISDAQALYLKAANTQEELDELKQSARTINKLLLKLFAEIGIDLIDFKLEYGRDNKGQLVLGDEISPDSCRLWDKKTGEKLDKDRFRRDLGKIEESYQEVWNRIKNQSRG